MRYFLGLVVTVILAILIIVLLLRGGGGPEKKPINLPDYISTSAVARLTIDNPVSATESHRSVEITIGNDEANIDLIKGYEGDVIKNRTYPMNENAFAVFLRALQYSGFTRGDDAKELRDERGHCPLGNRYVYEMIGPDDESIVRYWSTSCSDSGTFKGDAGVIEQLFQAQIPDYYDITEGTDL